MAGDYYEQLGLAADATADDIKKAFRAIARKCHPDVAGDDPVAAATFKAAREAYETLVDPEARARYDRRNERQRVVRQSGSHGSFFDAMWRRTARAPSGFDEPGGAGAPGPKPRAAAAHDGGGQPADSRSGGRDDAANAVDLDDLFAGGFGTRAREAGRPRPGARRVDIGEDPTASWHRADGSAPSPFPSGPVAPDPAGPRRGDDLGLEVDLPLSVARGGGTVSTSYARRIRNPRWVPGGADPETVEVTDVLDLRVIPGTQTGQRLLERGKGHAGTQHGPYGDLYVTVRVVGDDAYAPPPAVDEDVHDDAGGDVAGVDAGEAPPEVDIGVAEAILGGLAVVQTPTGYVRVVIPAGTSSGTLLPLPRRQAGGALGAVRVRIVVPTEIDAESRALIEAFAARNPIDA